MLHLHMQTIESVQNIINEKPAVMLYFSAPTCNVCHALKPKLLDALDTDFKEVEVISIDISQTQDIPAHFGVFAIPTVLIFLEGREFIRKSRHMSIDGIMSELSRPYEMMFN